MIEYELYHYGVKGMKWGVRKKRKSIFESDGYRKMIKTVMKNKTINKGANKLTKYHMDKAKLKDRANRQSDADIRTGILKTGGSAKDIQRGLDAANAKVAAKQAAKAEKAAQRAMKKMEKQQYKDFLKQRSREILEGESFAHRLVDILTDGHVNQAKIEWGLRNSED